MTAFVIISIIYLAAVVRLVLGYARFRDVLLLLSLIFFVCILTWPGVPGLWKAVALLGPVFIGLFILGIALLIVIHNDKKKKIQ